MLNPLTKKHTAAKYYCHGNGDRAPPTVKLIQFCVLDCWTGIENINPVITSIY